MEIKYNLLNLPQSVLQSGIAQATYVYLADGTKVHVYTGSSQGLGDGYIYLGSLRYSQSVNTLIFSSTPFGGGKIHLI